MASKLIKAIAPQWAAKRELARAQIHMLERVQNSGYSRHGASTQKNAMRGWLSFGGSPDEDITDNIETLRERSRDLFMGSPLATGAIKTIRTNVVGSGLQLNAAPDAEYLGLTQEQRTEWVKNTEREFNLWANSVECDARRRQTFGQLQGLALMSALTNGDVFALMPILPRKNSIYDLRVQLIEADLIYTPSGLFNSVRGGIELDQHGAPVAAYIHEKYKTEALSGKYSRIPFFGEKTGRANILHVSQDWERVGQTRAAPILSPVIETLKQMTRYSEAELMASLISSMLTVFVKSNTPEQPIGQNIGFDEQVTDDEFSYELGNGAVVSLGDDEEIQTVNPARNNSSFDPFMISIVRQIGAALEIPYELLVKHFTSSYSASRAALLEAWKMFKMRRVWLSQSFCQPIYEEWLSEAVAKGRIKADGFFNDPAVRAAWCGATWFGPAQGQLNPLQEQKAITESLNNGTSTRKKAAAELGTQNWDDTAEQLGYENKKLTYLGIIKIDNAEVVKDEQMD